MKTLRKTPRVAPRISTLIVVLLAGCSATPPAPTIPGGILFVTFDWNAFPGQELGITRSVNLSGKVIGDEPISGYKSCFGGDLYQRSCDYIGIYSTTALYTPGLEYSGSTYESNVMPGVWRIEASASASSGVSAGKSCTVTVSSGETVHLDIKMGTESSCTQH